MSNSVFNDNLSKRVPSNTLRTWNYEAHNNSSVFGNFYESELDVWRNRWLWLYNEYLKLQQELKEVQREQEKQS